MSYPIVAQVPEYQVANLSDLENVPITGASPTTGLQVLGGLGKITREQSSAVVTHYNIQPAIDLFATAQDRDLGGIAADVRHLIKATAADAPKGSTVILRGQVTTMDAAFSGLFLGLIGAIALIYLLIVVNFQSWLDPFVIITAPARRPGGDRLDPVRHPHHPVGAGPDRGDHVQGVATANSILVVSFARERLAATGDAAVAAVEGRGHPLPAGVDDRPGHDHRHGADGARSR
ncbi:MAG: efflux RND transporter permease subunit [Caulobacteraceae bacterium]